MKSVFLAYLMVCISYRDMEKKLKRGREEDKNKECNL